MHERVTDEPSRVVRASREIEAPAERIFELIADPSQQPSWDGNDNLAESKPGQRVHAVGDVFTTTLTNGWVRENHIVEFEEARRVAWRPSEAGKQPPGHLWRWELNPLGATRTEVTHTYDWSNLDPDDTMRNARARTITAEKLAASLENLAKTAELPQS
ncbi:polyketide cyclase [Amycolatopsis sp. A1MSW2902]